MTNPCEKCKRESCPKVCYPFQDYFRAWQEEQQARKGGYQPKPVKGHPIPPKNDTEFIQMTVIDADKMIADTEAMKAIAEAITIDGIKKYIKEHKETVWVKKN